MFLRAGSFLIYGLAWVLAGLIAWALHDSLSATTSDGRVQQVFLGVAIAVAILIGNSATGVLSLRLPLVGEQHALVMLGAHWGVAAAAGWNVAVMVGGPTSGVATSISAYRLNRAQPWRQGALLLLAVFAGRVAMEMPGGTTLWLGGLWCSLFIAVAVTAAASVFQGSMVSLRVAISILWWGGAWVLAYWLKSVVGMPSMANYGPNSLELIIAFGIGGAMAGVPAFDVYRMLCWAIGGFIASLVGIVTDLALTALLVGGDAILSGQPQYLDFGQVVGMGVGAISAVLLCRFRKSADA